MTCADHMHMLSSESKMHLDQQWWQQSSSAAADLHVGGGAGTIPP